MTSKREGPLPTLLRQQRERMGLNYVELEKRTNVPGGTICSWMKGQYRPRWDEQILAVAEVLEINTEQLRVAYAAQDDWECSKYQRSLTAMQEQYVRLQRMYAKTTPLLRRFVKNTDERQRTWRLLARISNRLMAIPCDNLQRPTFLPTAKWRWGGDCWQLDKTDVLHRMHPEYKDGRPTYTVYQRLGTTEVVVEYFKETTDCAPSGHIYLEVEHKRKVLQVWATGPQNGYEWGIWTERKRTQAVPQ